MENIKNPRYCNYLPKNYGIKNVVTNDITHNIPIGVKAPNFTSISTHGECSLTDYKGKWCILFSHLRKF